MSASLSTHVLDTARGRPAAGVAVEVLRGDAPVAAAETDDDGRISPLAEGLPAGRYRVVFRPPSEFFLRVEVEVELGEGHYHVPLLVSPFGCTTYRGS
ncbi:MAG: hydroxyisourate hydrolase [Thermoleophilia bacterium]|nr:hydroxyisourate hydrolase [Thermoleophilia bacterium]